MKNMKITAKLLSCFAIVIVLSLIIGIVGIVGMVKINNDGTDMYVNQTKPLPTMGKILEYSQRLRVQFRNCVIYTGNTEKLASVESDIKDRIAEFERLLDDYSGTIVNAEARTKFDEARDIYEKNYRPGLEKTIVDAKNGVDQQVLIDVMDSLTEVSNKMVDNFSRCMEIKSEAAASASADGDTLAMSMLILIIAVLVVSVIASVWLALHISHLISRPVNFMKNILMQIGTKGNLAFSASEMKEIEEQARLRDEVGESVGMLLQTVQRLSKVGAALETVANGDLTHDLDLLSNQDTMGLSLKKMVENLNEMFSEINTASYQVSTGSKQVADGSQSLAQGSTEQAAAVEELSSSISEIADKTRQNAEMAREAATLSETIRGNAEKGSGQMEQMMQAVNEINTASQSISKVIGVIDNIAFQTNILALNAAVEAARAGQHGKGFAVVAEEVRSLATKSADAARETGGMIANSIDKATTGNQIAIETSASLKEIVEGINRSTEIVTKIADSSEEQAMAIGQINKGIDQVAQVVQQNSATAEQSAAASEEMSGQSSLLQELIAQFKIKDEGPGGRLPARKQQNRQLSMPPKSGSYEEGFGKY